MTDIMSPISLNEDFLEEARRRAKERATERFYDGLEELLQNPTRQLNPSDYTLLGAFEKAVVYDMAGSVIAAIIRSNEMVCDAVQWQNKDEKHPAHLVVEAKEFTLLRSDDGQKPLQISVSDIVYQGVLTAEITFRLHREGAVSFKSLDVKEYFVENLMNVWTGSGLPQCHFIGRKILKTFLDARLKEYGKVLKEKMRAQEEVNRSSKSVAMRQAANHMLATGAK